MANIITNDPMITDSAIREAALKEFRWGMMKKKAEEKVREMEAAKEAKDLRGQGTVKGLGKAVVNIPQWEYFRLVQEYGYKEVHSKGFLQFIQKKYPHLKIHSI